MARAPRSHARRGPPDVVLSTSSLATARPRLDVVPARLDGPRRDEDHTQLNAVPGQGALDGANLENAIANTLDRRRHPWSIATRLRGVADHHVHTPGPSVAEIEENGAKNSLKHRIAADLIAACRCRQPGLLAAATLCPRSYEDSLATLSRARDSKSEPPYLAVKIDVPRLLS